ncbi:MAG: carbohydrate-binding domain-containing protein [Eubacterium sp.]|nr:carbohydrate-binding domain-containing protein [Eubacterium sp.]
MNSIKRFSILILSVLIISAFVGCSAGNKTEMHDDNSTTKAQAHTNIPDDSDMFTERDKDTNYDETKAIKITLAKNSIKCSKDKVKISGNTATILGEGTYIISGKLNDGQIVVDADDSDKLQLVLDGAEINCNSSAPIYVKQADKVFVTLAPNSKNTLTNNKEFVADGDTNVDSVIFSKDDITLNGNGSLEINTTCGHGIVSKDDLKLTSGTFNINASGHAVRANDSVRIAGGEYTFTSQKNGIHAENSKDASLGFVYISGGNINIKSDNDGIDSSSYTQIKNGNINIIAGGGAENAEVKRDEFEGFHNGNYSDNDESSVSAKGIKADAELTVDGGTININSADDAIHSNSDVSVNGAEITISTGDDGIHSDSNIVIYDGTINISQSYEGIEGNTVEIKGGTISVKASDDGLNASGGKDSSGFDGGMRKDEFAADSSASITISGGKLTVNAFGDGIDSNGNLYVSGGETYVSGPENGGNGALDYNGEANITGGIFVAAGDSGMAQNFGENSTQGSILYNSTKYGKEKITLKDKKGNEILSFTPENSYNSVVVSTPEIEKGETYILEMNGESYSIEMNDVIYGTANEMKGMGGMGPGRGGGMGRKPKGDFPR